MSRQSEFRSAILDPARPMPPDLLDGTGQPAGRRFSVYRNNVAVSLTEALEQTFPVIRKLIGAQAFATVAGGYLRAHPPQSPVLSRYGAEFPDYLARCEPLAHLGYLPDTARLERALVDSYHAADAAPIDPAIFAQTPPDDLPRLRLRLAPATRLLRAPWPVHGIWRFNTEENAPQPPHHAQDVLVTRPDFDPLPRLLPPGGADFLAATASDAPLGTAMERATETAPEFDLSTLLGLLLQDNAITDATLDEAP